MYENYKGFEDEDDFTDGDALAEWFVNSELGQAVKRVTDEAKKRDAIINPVVYVDMLKTASAFERLSGVDKVDVSLTPGYKSGSLRIACREFDINSNNMKPLIALLNNASAFSAEPRSDGGVNVNISFKNLFLDEKSQS